MSAATPILMLGIAREAQSVPGSKLSSRSLREASHADQPFTAVCSSRSSSTAPRATVREVDRGFLVRPFPSRWCNFELPRSRLQQQVMASAPPSIVRGAASQA